jgi:malate dehydrogenase (oxaloacetate-decarboxylating)(NADP+)
VFHDDQHGTAIITGAALINALEILEKKLDKVKVVFVGAGAAAVACAEQYVKLGVTRENLYMCDKFGLVYKGRPEDMDEWKGVFAQGTRPQVLAEVLKGADVVVGLSAKGVLTKEMIAGLAPNPVVFALANPVPEITPEEVLSVRKDAIMATGRSDYPNQVNNVLGFPGIFRGALDVRAKSINDEMKLAASRALAALAREDVPESVSAAYGGQAFHFGRDYIIPKPFDPRVLLAVAPAVAQAAVDTGWRELRWIARPMSITCGAVRDELTK